MFENLHKISLISIEKAPVTQPNIYSLVRRHHTDLKVLEAGKKVPAMRLYLPSNLPISGLKFIEKQIF